MAGEAKEEQSPNAGNYSLGSGLINQYPHWLKTDGSRAIWLNKVSNSWFVGLKANLGKNHGGIAGPPGTDSFPNEIEQGWRFWQNGGFKVAYRSFVIFKVIS